VAHQVLLVIREEGEILDYQDLKDHLERWENVDHKGSRAHQDLLEKLEVQETLDKPDLPENLELLE